MNPDLLLSIVAALAGFLLKTTLAFAMCLAFSRLIDSPNSRFLVWLGFLSGAGAYWLWLANGFLAEKAARGISATVAHALIQPGIQPVIPTAGAGIPAFWISSSWISNSWISNSWMTPGSWTIPSSWAFPLGIALRALGIAYLLVLSYIFLAHLKRQRQLKWVLGFSSKPPVELEEAFQPLAESLHVKRSRLLVLAGATSPATFGWVRPTILLPEACLEQDRSDLEDIFLHELHHVRRCDFFWNGVAAACRALLFFHPAAWYALKRMQFDRELACDLAVVSHSPGRRAKYAECLTRFARLNLSQGARTWGVDFAASSEHLKARVRSILTGSKKPSVWLVCLRAACGLGLFAGFLSFAPSMAVLLSYAPGQMSQPEMSQPLSSTLRDSGTENGRRAERRVRSLRPAAAAASIDRALPSPVEAGQFPQPAPESAHQQVQDTPSTPKLVPGLIRRHLPPGARGAAGDSRATQQSITLIDPGSASHGGNKANPDRGKSVQQSALLAGSIYRRLADVKPDR